MKSAESSRKTGISYQTRKLFWSYPPFDFDVDELWHSYNKLKLIAFKIEFSADELEATFSDDQLKMVLKRFERFKVRLMNDIYALEDEDSMGLFLGKCTLCMRCTREFGMQCKMPLKMRYPIEALGGDEIGRAHV